MNHDKWKDRDTLAYQESVTAPLNWSFDEDNNGIDEDEESNEENEDPAVTIKSAIEKVSKSLCLIKIMIAHKIIWAIRSSLQHQQTWYTEVKITLLNLDTSPIKFPHAYTWCEDKVVIYTSNALWVKVTSTFKTTIWSSSLLSRHALDFFSVIDSFVAKNWDLDEFKLGYKQGISCTVSQ